MVSCHGTSVKEQNVWLYRCVGWYNMNLQYPRYHGTNPMFLLVDNSDSPSIVEQSQQGCDSSCYTLLAVVPSSGKYPIHYACQLASCNMGVSCCVLLSLVSLCLYVPHVLLFCNTINWGSAVPFYPGCFCTEPWDSLSDYVHPGIACLACWASNWAAAFWGSLPGL